MGNEEEIQINNGNLNHEEIKQEMIQEMERFIILPPNCPSSAIVHSDHDNHKKIARQLYLKYIQSGSEFEINLRWSDRKRYSKLMENEISWLLEKKYVSNPQLFELFDVCISEMCGLLIAAFSRYKQSPEYLLLK